MRDDPKGCSNNCPLTVHTIQVGPDRSNRFTDGRLGVLCDGKVFETAPFETIDDHALFMVRTAEEPGWTAQFREIILSVSADLHDLRGAG